MYSITNLLGFIGLTFTFKSEIIGNQSMHHRNTCNETIINNIHQTRIFLKSPTLLACAIVVIYHFFAFKLSTAY